MNLIILQERIREIEAEENQTQRKLDFLKSEKKRWQEELYNTCPHNPDSVWEKNDWVGLATNQPGSVTRECKDCGFKEAQPRDLKWERLKEATNLA